MWELLRRVDVLMSQNVTLNNKEFEVTFCDHKIKICGSKMESQNLI